MIIHSIHSLEKETGGPARTVPLLCNSLCHFYDIALYSDISGNSDCIKNNDKILLLDNKGVRSNYDLIRADGIKIEDIKIIHDHGVWLKSNYMIYKMAKSYSIPLILSPRGMLEPWSMKHKWFKKKIAWHLYQKKVIAYASVLHATAENEAENLRSLGFTQPIAVIPNGVDFPYTFPVKGNKERNSLLFLSRIHPKKGLENLLRAWKDVQDDGWEINIAGPCDNENYLKHLKQLQFSLGLKNINFLGNLENLEKWQVYSDADLFVLPTSSENFGVVVAEAMAAGVPVITTKGAPWKILEDNNCGWWIELGVEPLARAIKEGISMTESERMKMGGKAKVLSQSRFEWNRIAEQMAEVYRWCITGDEKPDCLLTE